MVKRNNFCICGSGKPLEKCCERFLKAGLQAKTPEQLMRSRYSAYALGGYGGYLLKTWFPATAKGLTAKALSEPSCEWLKLEVLNRFQKGDDGEVEFNAYYHDASGDVKLMHEKSIFRRVAGRWYYVGGEVGGT